MAPPLTRPDSVSLPGTTLQPPVYTPSVEDGSGATSTHRSHHINKEKSPDNVDRGAHVIGVLGSGQPPVVAGDIDNKSAPGISQLWITPEHYDQVRDWLDKRAPMQEALQGFLKRRAGWFDTAGQNGGWSAAAVIGIARYRQILTRTAATYDQIRTGIHSPVARSEGWQDPEAFDALDQDLQFNAMFVPIIDRLITVAQNQRSLASGDNVLRYATPLVHVAVEDFFIGIAAASSEDPLVKAAAPDMLGNVAQHIGLLARYDQVTARYQKVLTRLKQLTSPLVGADVPWQGYYPPEYPAQTDYNPSTLPDEHLNDQPLQKAFRAVMGGPLEEGYRQVFKALNRDPATSDHQKAELMADALWDEGEKKFAPWNGTPWTRLEEVTTRREAVVERMEELAKAAEPYAPQESSLADAVRQMDSAIRDARQVLKQMEMIWKGGGIIPSVREDRSRLAPIMAQVDRAEGAIDAAAGALRQGDKEHALKQLLQAQRAYVNGIGTPRFKSLTRAAEGYQRLSFSTQLGVTVATTVLSGGIAGVVAAGTKGALIARGASAMLIRGGSLFAAGAVFSVSASSLNHVLINEPLPKGVSGWSYEVGSNTVMFGALEKIAMRYGRPLGMWAKGELTRVIGAQAKGPWLGWIPTVGGGVAEMAPTYLFFAGAWTPVDQMGQQFFVDSTFSPLAVLSKSYSGQSLIMQLGFLAALGVSNKLFAALPLINRVNKFVGDYVNNSVNHRVQTLVDQRVAAQQQLKDFSGRWATDPAAVVGEGAALMTNAAATARRELDFLSLFDHGVQGIASHRAELRGLNAAYLEGAQRFRVMTQVTSVLQQACAHIIAPGLVAYDPAMQGAIRGLTALGQSQFSLRDSGGGTFVLAWEGRFGDKYEVTLVPEPAGPLSTATDIVPR